MYIYLHIKHNYLLDTYADVFYFTDLALVTEEILAVVRTWL